MKMYSKIMTALLIGGASSVAAVATIGYQGSLNKTEASVSTGTFRFWLATELNNSFGRWGYVPKLWFHTGSGNDDSNKGKEVLVVGETGNWDNQWEKGYNGTEARRYYYFDISTKAIGNYLSVQYWKDGNFVGQGDAVQFTAENVGKVCYFWNDYKGSSFGQIGTADAGLAAKALEGLLTCSDSKINGYNAFPTIRDTFIKNGGNWKLEGNLGGNTILDYASSGDYGDASKKNVSVDAWDKYQALEAQYNAHKAA